MKKLVLIAAIVAATGCATARASRPSLPDTTGITAVRGRYHWGQVCPISPTEAWTAEHVSSMRLHYGDMEGVPRPLMFAEAGGTPGTVLETVSDARRDLAMVLAVDGTFQKFYSRRETPPVLGEVLTIVGYNIDRMPLIVTAKLRAIVAGSLVYDDTPGFGSSGSCVLDSEGRLVGINTAMAQLPSGKYRGLAWALYGAWGEIPVAWQERVQRPEPKPEPIK